jgi:hypothetical protein
MGQKIAIQFTHKGEDVKHLTKEIDTDDIEEILEYKDKPDYCEIIHFVDGKRITQPIPQSQESLRSQMKPFSTRKELDVEAMMSDFSYDGGDM